MELKEAKIEGGVLKWRLPNIPEAFILLGKLGIGEPGNVKKGQNYEFILVGKCMNEIEDLCTLPPGKTWDEIVSNIKNANALADIASQVLKVLMFEEKKSKN